MADHDVTHRNPAWLAFLYEMHFCNDEMWTLYLENVHTGREQPPRLVELKLEYARLKREFRARCNKRR